MLFPLFSSFSTTVRKVIYTTNAIESLNSTYRKLNRQRSVFPSDTALLKALYLATFEVTKKVDYHNPELGPSLWRTEYYVRRDAYLNNQMRQLKRQAGIPPALDMQLATVIYKTRAISLIRKLIALNYHRRILFTEIFSYTLKRCVMLKSIGLYFRKIDFLNFAVGAIMPIIVLFIVYSSVKSNIILQDTDFLSLLMNHKGKFIFYFFVSFIEEVIFRGIIFGLLLQKCKNKYLSCVIAALIFTLPHIFNTDNISVLVMFIFPFLYGIFANEMFYTTKSIWMPTGFHWLWNYTITSLFLVTGTQSFIYVHIIAAMIIMIPLFYIVIGKTRVE